MPTDETAQYYANRRLASVAMSEKAKDPAVQKIHLELARRYADLVGDSVEGAANRLYETSRHPGMTRESDKQFNDRRAIEERSLADHASDSVQSIPHNQLSRLHAEEADADRGAGLLRETALEIAVVDGQVTLAAAGEVTSLSPRAAFLTADRLAARAHDAERHHAPTRSAHHNSR